MNTTNIGKYKVNYINSKEFHILKNEIFGNECYKADLEKNNPYIIDTGAHIGLSVIYFKSIYPDAEILAFEPNPYTRKILEENIFINNLNNIEILPYALDSSEGERDFYIDMTPSQWQSTAGFNKNSWNGQYLNNTSVRVQTKKLSTYLDKPVDLLKMDIEGLETKVLTESKDLLKNVKHIIIEYHPIKKKNFNTLVSLLKNEGFKISLFKNGGKIENTNYKDLLIIKGRRI